jgi:hypothetical protein
VGVKSARLGDRARGRSWNAGSLAEQAVFHIGDLPQDLRTKRNASMTAFGRAPA